MSLTLDQRIERLTMVVNAYEAAAAVEDDVADDFSMQTIVAQDVPVLITAIKRLQGENRSRELKEYRYECSGCHTFTKRYFNHCPECGREGYLSGSFKREDLEEWFDARQALEGATAND